jgi:hypothetical protein
MRDRSAGVNKKLVALRHVANQGDFDGLGLAFFVGTERKHADVVHALHPKR